MLGNERLLLGPAAIELVLGYRPSYGTFFRWTESGLLTRSGSRVTLEYLECGHRRMTSVEAVQRFCLARTLPEEVPTSVSRTNRQREKHISDAELALDN